MAWAESTEECRGIKWVRLTEVGLLAGPIRMVGSVLLAGLTMPSSPLPCLHPSI